MTSIFPENKCVLDSMRDMLVHFTACFAVLIGRSWAYHGKGRSLQTYNFKSILTLHRPETPSTDLVSHNIPLHAMGLSR